MRPTLDNTVLRMFLPTRDFEESKRFYEALGFAKVLDGEVAIFDTAEAGGIILQRYYNKDWAENLMLSLQVDDLDAWWAHIDSLDLAENFGVRPPAPPKDYPWGLREVHLIDPAGVLWHFIQNRQTGGAD
jgi:uncharacterized glyoxalase superfamily protein PhnB